MEISNFFNIKIEMELMDPLVPTIIAIYQEHKILVNINEIEVIKGAMPRKQLNLILGWCALHESELMHNYKLILEGKEQLELQGLKKY